MIDYASYFPVDQRVRNRLSKECGGKWESIEDSLAEILMAFENPPLKANRDIYNPKLEESGVYDLLEAARSPKTKKSKKIFEKFGIERHQLESEQGFQLPEVHGFGLTRAEAFFVDFEKREPESDIRILEELRDVIRNGDYEFFDELHMHLKGHVEQNSRENKFQGTVKKEHKLSSFIRCGWCNPSMPLLGYTDEFPEFDYPFCFWSSTSIAQCFEAYYEKSVTPNNVSTSINRMKLVSAVFRKVDFLQKVNGKWILDAPEKGGKIKRLTCLE